MLRSRQLLSKGLVRLTVPRLRALGSAQQVAPAPARDLSKERQSKPQPSIRIQMNAQTEWANERIPRYLNDTYWWAYIHPKAVSFFERQWLVNWILWGNYQQLRDAAFEELQTVARSAAIATKTDCNSNSVAVTADSEGRSVLQIACVYGDFSHTLLRKHLKASDVLHIVDIAPVQLQNTAEKLLQADTSSCVFAANTNAKDTKSDCSKRRQVVLSQCDSGDLAAGGFAEASMDCVLLFFLLHEMPSDVRLATVTQALRVLKPGGDRKLVIVDYHKPHQWYNPFLHIMRPVLTYIEPFAIDLWKTPIEAWLRQCHRQNGEAQSSELCISKDSYFGGLYQKLVVSKIPRLELE